VIFVRGLNHDAITIKMINNVFSNFGNIKKIIFTKNKGQALIEFQNKEQSTLTCNMLNNLKFFGSVVKVALPNLTHSSNTPSSTRSTSVSR
jgi:RNA recognition motif-containing protein